MRTTMDSKLLKSARNPDFNIVTASNSSNSVMWMIALMLTILLVGCMIAFCTMRPTVNGDQMGATQSDQLRSDLSIKR